MSTVERNAVIAEEQLAVDHIYDCVNQDRKAVESFRLGNLGDCPDAGLASHPDLPKEYGRREDLGHQPLVIERIDLIEDPDDKLTWYIGRAKVRDPQGDLALVNWTSKTAIAWRLAGPDDPGDVRRRRKLRCEGPKVLDYSDTEIQVITAKGETVPAPVIEDEPDPFLLADLDLARDGVMRDIVETIQRHQLRLVADDRKGLLVIQGGPGTGKTAVGLHRVTWLLDNKFFTPDQVLVIGPHKPFLHYVREVLPRLGSHGVATVDIAALWPGDVRGADRIAAAQESALPGIGQQITVMPAHTAAGLEFDHVVVVEPHLFAEQNSAGLRQLYVALTRCTQSLTVLHSSPLPAELGGPVKTPVAAVEKAPVAPPPTGERFADGDEFRVSLKERASSGRKQAAHARLKHMLAAELYGNERVPQLDTDFADIVCEGTDGLGFYVISTQDADTYAELRALAPQLLEAEWASAQEIDRLFLVLPKEPQDLWAVEVVKRLFDVSIIWRTETGWAGPSVDAALGR